MSPFAALLLSAAAVLATPQARAQDGVYGRLDGDLDLSLGAGAGYAADAALFVARTSAVYAATAGLYFNYTDTFGQSAARIDRSLAAGVTLRPLFWARFAEDFQGRSPYLDLFVDSFSFDVGAFWAAPLGRSLDPEPGLEIAAGIAFPFLPAATGPWLELRGALRWRAADMSGALPSDLGDRGAFVSLTLSWHHLVNAHIADAGDRLRR